MTTPTLSAEQIKEQALRDGIRDLMAECTEKQNAFMHRIHNSAPWKGLDNCPADKLAETYELARRTVAENEKRGLT